jgi:ubiquitin-activating enzyme E1
MSKLDINLYDRQIRTYGEEAVRRMTTSSVTIIGLDGVGTEIAKNLALGGIKNICLYDNNIIKEEDLETGFYYSINDLNKVRSFILKDKIQELNQYVSVLDINNDYEITKDTILIIVNQTPNTVKTYENNYKDNKVVAVFSKGCAGAVFVNAGKNHLITDVMGENIEPVQIGSINSDGVVLCAPHHSHDYQSGDIIKFTNVQGNNAEQFNEVEFKISVISPVSFKLNDFTFTDFTFTNGTSNYIRKPKYINHKTFEEQLKEPEFNFSFDDSSLIFDTLMRFFEFKDVITTCDKIFDNETQINLANTFFCELMPVVSLIGSVAASEAIKLITNKYLPINQIWCWYEPKLIPKNKPINVGKSNLGKLYGIELEKSISESSWFLVGSGAIGCELLKNLAFCNVSTKGTVYLTDPDTIEKSNLNRQFLFRTKHIGKPKSQMAAESIKTLRPNINIHALTDKVCSANQNFTDEIMKKVTGVFNALDNIDARKYMDQQCFYNQLPLFESGTTGTKGNTQPVIPFLTETYSNSADPPQEKSFPICTIKSFPNQISHTIHWAMDNFEVFNRAPLNVNKWIENNNVFDKGDLNETSQGKEDVLNFLINMKIKTFEDCVYRAVDMFYNNFKTQIDKLLSTFPANHVNEDGSLYWSNGKRAPKSIELDLANTYHYDYIEATSNLLARCYGLSKNDTDIKLIVSSYKFKEIVSENGVDIKLPSNDEYKTIKLYNQEFEKDDSTNWHVEWVNATSNMRAINYGIPPITKQETKGIAGRIIPAIATTTSVVSGLIVIEMIKYMLSKNNLIEEKIENYRSTFVNLADTSLLYSEPIPSKEIEIAGKKFNSWKRFDKTSDCTLEEFKEYYEKLFETKLSMIVYDNALLYSDFMENEDSNKILMSKLINDKNSDINLSINSVVITIASDDDNINLPDIHFKI